MFNLGPILKASNFLDLMPTHFETKGQSAQCSMKIILLTNHKTENLGQPLCRPLHHTW